MTSPLRAGAWVCDMCVCVCACVLGVVWGPGGGVVGAGVRLFVEQTVGTGSSPGLRGRESGPPTIHMLLLFTQTPSLPRRIVPLPSFPVPPPPSLPLCSPLFVTASPPRTCHIMVWEITAPFLRDGLSAFELGWSWWRRQVASRWGI